MRLKLSSPALMPKPILRTKSKVNLATRPQYNWIMPHHAVEPASVLAPIRSVLSEITFDIAKHVVSTATC